MRISLSATCIFLLILTAHVAPGIAASSVNLNVSVTILSTHKCSFATTSTSLNFGILNSIAAPNVTATADPIRITCTGNPNDPIAFGLTDDAGLYETASSNRMKNSDPALSGPDAFIPYGFSMSTASDPSQKGSPGFFLTVEGRIPGGTYRTVYAGGYEDTITITFSP